MQEVFEELHLPQFHSVSFPFTSLLGHCDWETLQEMDSLQKQMEEHTVTVHQSICTWNSTEGELTELTSNNGTQSETKQSKSKPVTIYPSGSTLADDMENIHMLPSSESP